MKATGIVRKIDDLGRVVIPKEIRKNLKIREGDPLEIYIEKTGEIVLRKYAPMGELLEIIEQYAETLSDISDFVVCISDTETIIAVAGTRRADYLEKNISEHVITIMQDRAIWSNKEERVIPIIEDENPAKYHAQIVVPIISDADVIGSVIMFSTDYKKNITNVEYKLAQAAAKFLSKQME